jgi:DNA-binding HxlR family transcriptional regulator
VNLPRKATRGGVIYAPMKYMDVLDALRDGEPRTARHVAAIMYRGGVDGRIASRILARLEQLAKVEAVAKVQISSDPPRFVWRITEEGYKATYSGRPA